MVAAGVVVAAATVALGVTRPPADAAPLGAAAVAQLGAFLSFVLLGALVVVRVRGHPVGWLLAALGLTVLLQQATQEYALRGAATDAPGWALASWVAIWMITPPLVLLVAVLLLFPDGRPPSPAWRVPLWIVAIGGAVLTAVWAATTWPLRGAVLVTGGRPPAGAVLATVDQVLVACIPVAVASLVVRHRSAPPDVRRQLRWLLLSAVVLLVAVVAGIATAAVGAAPEVTEALGSVGLAGVAVAIAVAILRHRLYEIDRILSRTIAWLLLSAVLGAAYVGAVVVTGAVLDPVAPDSSLAVAVSTLAVAGAANPLRIRLQRAVDHRFNRDHHDRAQTASAFGARLRDEVRLDELTADLCGTVAHLLHPQQASVWLHPSVPPDAPRAPRAPVTGATP